MHTHLTLKILLLMLLCTNSLSVLAQESHFYWIFLQDKDTTDYHYQDFLSPECLQNRQLLGLPLFQATDIPLKKAYLDTLQKDIQILQTSRWLNAVCAALSPQQAQKISQYPFVRQIKAIKSQFQALKNREPTGNPNAEIQKALEQIQYQFFVQNQLNGKGVKIGITDSGFYYAHKNRQLKHIFERKGIVAVKDFVSSQTQQDFKDMAWDTHGTEVWLRIAGISKQAQTGIATESEFFLARTETDKYELRSEEANWVAALEWLDSLGVRLVNTSLGYALDFSDSSQDYSPWHMDGATCLTTKAAQIAAQEKGMIIVAAAGNEGDDVRWRIVSSPADSPFVISVGASYPDGTKAPYSSIGADFVNYVKPNLAVYSEKGTSYAAPIVTGFVAALLQKKPNLGYQEVQKIMESCSSLYPYANNYVGMGLPNAAKALALLNNEELRINYSTIKAKEKAEIQVGIIDKKSIALCFHKKNDFVVLKEGKAKHKNGILSVERQKNAQKTTLYYQGRVWEIIWEN